MDPLVARKTWRTLEPLHGMIYFAPEAREEYARLGLSGSRMGYFASRSAALGPVPAEVVIAAFYNFNPELVRSAIPAAWEVASPAAWIAARRTAALRALRRGLGSELSSSETVAEAARLARRAATAASDHIAGRPLYAAHAALDWPRDPLLQLWHAQTLLREFRGDGHIACLLVAELDPVEALVMHEASGELPPGALRTSRAWGESAWADGVERLRTRGLVTGDDPPSLTDAGRALRQEVEDRTDARSLPPYATLGQDGCERLRQLARPLSQAVVAAGLLDTSAMSRSAGE